MNRKGFMLLELLIATLITSILSGLLLKVLEQTNRFQATIDSVIDIHTRAILVHNQLERDIIGGFLPIQALKKNDLQKEKKIDKVFFSANKDNNLDILSFITNNPLTVYWSTKIGQAKPKIARVVYRLLPEKDRKNSFVLMRQEGLNLNFDTYKIGAEKAPHAYELIAGIKTISVMYTVTEENEKQKENKKIKPKIKIFKEWIWPKKEEAKKKIPPIPELIEIKIVLWDNTFKKDMTFIFTFPLLKVINQTDNKKKEPEEKKKKEADIKKQAPPTSIPIKKQTFVFNQKGIGKKVHNKNGRT